jgi:sialic acid synthase
MKFQTRNNKHLFSECAYNKDYNSENAFGDIYGVHREKLELNTEWLPILKKDCEDHGVKFMSTPFDKPSLDLICDVGVDILKIASFDLGNLPFINRIAKKGIPVVMSIGAVK